MGRSKLAIPNMGPLRISCLNSLDNGWVGSSETGHRLAWGEAGHLRWAGPRRLRDRTGNPMPSIQWGTEQRDPARIMYLEDRGIGSIPRGYEIVRTCDFHLYPDGGDRYCMNMAHWELREIAPVQGDLIDLLDKDSSPGHWLWKGGATDYYGTASPYMYFHGRRMMARLLVYNLFGPPSSGAEVMVGGHTHNMIKDYQLCDEPMCVAPIHHYPAKKGGLSGSNSGRKPATACRRGHPLLKEGQDFWLDKYNRKHCRECNRLRGAEFRERAITGKNPRPSSVPLTLQSGLFRLGADLASIEEREAQDEREPTNGRGSYPGTSQTSGLPELAADPAHEIDERALQDATDELTALLGF